MFSRDGTKLAFLRRERPPTDTEPELISIQVANADGTNPLDLTGPLDAPDQWDWSPAGDAIALTSKIDGRHTLQVVPTDGSERLRVLDTGMAVTWPFWLPPNGDEIMFRGVAKTPNGLRSGLFAISPEGGEPRPLTATDGQRDGRLPRSGSIPRRHARAVPDVGSRRRDDDAAHARPRDRC